MSTTTQIATKQKTTTVETLLEAGKDQIQRVLPAVVQSDRFIRVALTEIRKSRQLQACNPVSICASVMQAAQLGLEFGSTLGHVYLIPYKDEATLQVGYRGLMHLARRSGAVKSFESRLVYDGDIFKVTYGTNPAIEHDPQFKTSTITHIYAVATLNDGTKMFEVMTKEQIDEHRAKYAQRNAATWDKAYEEMARKTVVKRLIKYLPITPEVADALELEARFEPEQHDPEKIQQSQNSSTAITSGEAQHARVVLATLFSECAELGIDTDDVALSPEANEQQILAVTQILKERLTTWKKSTAELQN